MAGPVFILPKISTISLSARHPFNFRVVTKNEAFIAHIVELDCQGRKIPIRRRIGDQKGGVILTPVVTVGICKKGVLYKVVNIVVDFNICEFRYFTSYAS